MERVKTRHEELKKIIARHDHLYHVEDKPEISDFEYDSLFRELLELESSHRDLETSDSPSRRVGGLVEAFEKLPHRRPMLSLSNSYESQDIFDFDDRLRKILKLSSTDAPIEYFCEPKFDGLALELIYEDGILVKALTRGDGLEGENVTANIRTIHSIPLRLTSEVPSLFEIRGEIIMFREDFKILNEQQESDGFEGFANPRNAAAGSVRLLDSRITAQRPLSFLAYGLSDLSGLGVLKQSDIYSLFKKLKIPHQDSLSKICLGAQAVVDFYSSFRSLRGSLPFDTDGIVIKVNSFFLQEDLGLVARSPRWATAAKFSPERAKTRVQKIEVQVGRTGVLTPVAVMEPVQVSGVQISHASLHNFEELARKDVRVGDMVVVHRAGDVIPEVIEVLIEGEGPRGEPPQVPNRCPRCNSPVVVSEEEIAIRCSNSSCPAILEGALKHFVSRRALNIEKFGDKIIEKLVKEALVRRFSDIYKLNSKDISNLDRQGEKSTQNLLKSIEKSKKVLLNRLIYALGIRFVGEQTSKLIADHFGSLERFQAATEEDLTSIPEVGPKVAKAIIAWISENQNQHELEELKARLEVINPTRSIDGPLAGRSFLVTGTLPVTRDAAKSLIESNGGKILSSVSSKLDFLIVGEDAGSKLKKAQDLGVKTLTWEDLTSMLNPAKPQ